MANHNTKQELVESMGANKALLWLLYAKSTNFIVEKMNQKALDCAMEPYRMQMAPKMAQNLESFVYYVEFAQHVKFCLLHSFFLL